MSVKRSDVIMLYYVKELKIEEMAKELGLGSGEAVRYHLFRKDPALKKRDRKWKQSDDYELATIFNKLKVSMGDNFNKDAEKIAIAMEARLSKIKAKLLPLWEAEFSRAIDNDHLDDVLKSGSEQLDEVVIDESNDNNAVDNQTIQEEVVELPNTSTQSVELKVYRIDKDVAEIPVVSTDGSVGLDLYASHDILIPKNGGQGTVRTGIVVKIPRGYAGFIMPRSGLSRNYGVTILNTPGLIDNDYCGVSEDGECDEVQVLLINHSSGSSGRPLQINRGDRVAQLVLVQVPSVTVSEVDAEEMGDSLRGGFGSTGV